MVCGFTVSVGLRVCMAVKLYVDSLWACNGIDLTQQEHAVQAAMTGQGHHKHSSPSSSNGNPQALQMTSPLLDWMLQAN